MASLMEGELSCYRGGQLERKWSCYRGGQFNGLSMVITEMAILMEGEWPCYRSGHFVGGRYGDTEVVSWKENSHFTL